MHVWFTLFPYAKNSLPITEAKDHKGLDFRKDLTTLSKKSLLNILLTVNRACTKLSIRL